MSFRNSLKKYRIREEDSYFEFDENVDIKTINLYYAKNNWILIGLEFLDQYANPICKIGTDTGNTSRQKTLNLDSKSRVIGGKAQAG